MYPSPNLAHTTRPIDVDISGADWERPRTFCHAATPLMWIGRHCWQSALGPAGWVDRCLDLITGYTKFFFGACPREWVCKDDLLRDEHAAAAGDEIEDSLGAGDAVDSIESPEDEKVAKIANAVCLPGKKRRSRGWRKRPGLRIATTSRRGGRAESSPPAGQGSSEEHRPLLDFGQSFDGGW